jgi:predicted phage terminase large subunit-like protein
MTRWHEDDLAGRILPEGWDGESGDILCKDGNVWRVLCIQAECQTDSDPLGRKRGEMLWPEWFTPKHWAQFRPNARTWGSLCQQLPKPKDGNLFNPDKIEIVDALPAGRIKWVRGWDLAATAGGGDYTAGPLLGVHQDSGRPIIADMVRGQWGPGERDNVIRNTAVSDGRTVKQDLPQDPGAAGNAVIEYLVKKLKGYSVVWGPESGDKEQRAEPLAAEVNVGNVMMLRADWNRKLLDEMRAFPNGTNDDQVDGLSRAYARLVPLPGKMSINKTLLNKVRQRQ